mgnify:CR=1 FL=1
MQANMKQGSKLQFTSVEELFENVAVADIRAEVERLECVVLLPTS